MTEDPDFGYYLESVNGVAGSKSDYTYWQILADINGDPIPIDVGEYPEILYGSQDG